MVGMAHDTGPQLQPAESVSTAGNVGVPTHRVYTCTGVMWAATAAPRTSVSPWLSRKVLTTITLISGIKPQQHRKKQF